MRTIRSVILRNAAEIARKENTVGGLKVTDDHVNRALGDLFSQPEQIELLKDTLRLRSNEIFAALPSIEIRDGDGREVDFSTSVFQHLERRLRMLRGIVRQRANELAAATGQPVSEVQIKEVLAQVLDEPKRIKYFMGASAERSL